MIQADEDPGDFEKKQKRSEGTDGSIRPFVVSGTGPAAAVSGVAANRGRGQGIKARYSHSIVAGGLPETS